MHFIPSSFYFSRSKEKEFQDNLNKNTVYFANLALYLAAFFLSLLTIMSWVSDEDTRFSMINILRMSMVFLSFVFIYTNNKLSPKNLHLRCFAYGVLFCFLFGYLFFSFVNTYGYLNEGGPMLAVASLSAIPMLHLAHKLVLWIIIGFSLLSIQFYSSTSISWSLFYYISMVFVMSCIQYHLDILLRRQYQAEVAETEKANIDQLTGLCNRHNFDSEFNNLFNKLTPSQSIAIAMIDIDNFKKYNDNYGHLDGDAVLVEVSKRLQQCDADIVVRFGGEEFILVKIIDNETSNWLEHLPEQFAINPIVHDYSSFKRITVSAGVAIANYSETPPEIKTLLGIADKAMYKAKVSGKNKVITEELPAQCLSE